MFQLTKNFELKLASLCGTCVFCAVKTDISTGKCNRMTINLKTVHFSVNYLVYILQ